MLSELTQRNHTKMVKKVSGIEMAKKIQAFEVYSSVMWPALVST